MARFVRAFGEDPSWNDGELPRDDPERVDASGEGARRDPYTIGAIVRSQQRRGRKRRAWHALHGNARRVPSMWSTASRLVRYRGIGSKLWRGRRLAVGAAFGVAVGRAVLLCEAGHALLEDGRGAVCAFVGV